MELRIRLPSLECAGELRERLWRAGAEVIELVEDRDAPRMSAELSAEAAHQIALELSALSVELVETAPRPRFWRRRFAPVVAPPLVVLAPDAPVPSAQRPVYIEPGLALGTPSGSTLLALEALMDRAKLGLRSFLDVGTGTGVLALAALRLGVPRVFATEIDPVAEAVARHNANLNALPLEIAAEPPEERFELVIANLAAPRLARLLPALVEHTHAELILTGLFEDELPALREAADAAGLDETDELAHEDWRALVLRPAPQPR